MSEYNKYPIDIVVPWVNPNDPFWLKEFNYWKEKECGETASCRFRDLEVFNYWFRCIEKNCKWCRYIWLILSSKTQIPKWLNTKHPKLKIVYHDEFINKTELPTFNSSVIICNISKIKDLSDNFILFNDDFFVVNKIEENQFFSNDLPKYKFIKTNKLLTGNTSWYSNINKGRNFIKTNFKVNTFYVPDHGPIPYSNKLQQFIWYKFKDFLNNSLNNSKFRQSKNITDWLFFDIQCQLKKTQNTNSIVQYINKSNFKINNKIICFNDNENLNNIEFIKFKNNVKQFLHTNFPKKSEFEI